MNHRVLKGRSSEMGRVVFKQPHELYSNGPRERRKYPKV